MRVIFAANRSLPIPAVSNHLVRQLAMLPMDAVVLLRKPKRGEPGAFERVTAELCRALRVQVEWAIPEGRGRSGVYDRNVQMVRSADRVVGYFDGETPLGGGTGHLLERAMADEIQAIAYVWNQPLESLEWLGSTD